MLSCLESKCNHKRVTVSIEWEKGHSPTTETRKAFEIRVVFPWRQTKEKTWISSSFLTSSCTHHAWPGCLPFSDWRDSRLDSFRDFNPRKPCAERQFSKHASKFNGFVLILNLARSRKCNGSRYVSKIENSDWKFWEFWSYPSVDSPIRLGPIPPNTIELLNLKSW